MDNDFVVSSTQREIHIFVSGSALDESDVSLRIALKLEGIVTLSQHSMEVASFRSERSTQESLFRGNFLGLAPTSQS